MNITAALFAAYLNSISKDLYIDDFNEDLYQALVDWDDAAKVYIAKDPAREFDLARDMGGYLVWQGAGPDPRRGVHVSMAADFQAWRSAQTHEQIVILVPKENVENIKAKLIEMGAVIAG